MKTLWCVLVFCLLPLAGFTQEDSEGDQKIRDTIEDIEEAEEKAREDPRAPRGRERRSETDYDDSGESELLGAIFELVLTLFVEYSATMRFSAYPYEPTSDFAYNTFSFVHPEASKIVALDVEADVAAHLDETWGLVNRVNLQISGFHLGFFHQQIFASEEMLTVLSGNAGVSIFAPGVLANAFGGFYTVTGLLSPIPSLGYSLRVFLPPRIHLEVWNLYGFHKWTSFAHLLAAVEVHFGRLSLGAGYHRSALASHLYHGPALRISCWL